MEISQSKVYHGKLKNTGHNYAAVYYGKLSLVWPQPLSTVVISFIQLQGDFPIQWMTLKIEVEVRVKTKTKTKKKKNNTISFCGGAAKTTH